MTKYINIHAKCNAFEIFEQVPESKAVARLKQIRGHYLWFKEHNHEFVPKKGKKRLKALFQQGFIPPQIDHTNKLTVKTRMVNPELPFK